MAFATLRGLLLAIALIFASSATLPPRADLCAVKTHKRQNKKTVHLHDIARNDSRNEYFAGGQDEEGRGSATVLIYPDEDKFDENKTDADEEPEPEPPKSRMSGTGRKL